MKSMRSTTILLGAAMAMLCLRCSQDADDAEDTGAATAEALSTKISSSYGVTTFGGPGDYQPLACGGHSRTYQSSMPWYAASSQRYGCGAHLKLTAPTGKCVVVSTEDAGPASSVETKAGMPVLDVSPAVGEHLFADGSLGWSDIKKEPDRYVVRAERTSLPVGPCDASVDASSDDAGSDDASSHDESGTADDDDDGPACSGDGQCNPGGDGAGKICRAGHCVDGCRTNAQCPGVKSCVAGKCR